MAASIGIAIADRVQPVEDLEMDLLLEGIFRRFGHDFRGYRREPLKQRLFALMQSAGVQTVSALQERVMHDPAAIGALLRALSARPTALFDDPDYFLALRAVVVPWLRSCPSPKVWLAECVSAEEVYALAILLADERLYDKTQIFATAANETLLQEARQGSFTSDRMPDYEQNYRSSGGKAQLGDYCSEDKGRIAFSSRLGSNITWAQYSLASDASFNEFQLIVCRRTLPEFGILLQHRALQLFYDSMPLFGILSVDGYAGTGAAPFISRYKAVSEKQGLYRRVV